MKTKNRNRHPWAVVVARIDWRRLTDQVRIVSTNKTQAAAEKASGRPFEGGERVRVVRSGRVNQVPRMLQWWPA